MDDAEVKVKTDADGRTVLWVGAGSNTRKLAGAVLGELQGNPSVIIRAIGAGSVNQAIKACAVARGILDTSGGGNLVLVPGFETVTMGGAERSAIILTVSVS